MAKRAAKKKKGSGKAPTVTLRIANEGRMATKKKSGKSRKGSHHRKKNPTKGHPRRRRRNPSTFWERAGKLAAGAGVAIGTGVLVTLGQSKIMPGSNVTLYGIPALGFLAGVGIARTMPTLGVGMALGSFAGFITPLASKALTAITPAPSTTTTTAAGLGRAYRGQLRGRMGAVDMRAVDYAYAGR